MGVCCTNNPLNNPQKKEEIFVEDPDTKDTKATWDVSGKISRDLLVSKLRQDCKIKILYKSKSLPEQPANPNILPLSSGNTNRDEFEEFFSNYVLTRKDFVDSRRNGIRDPNAVHIVVYGGSGTGKTTFGFEVSKKKRNEYYIPSLSTEIIKTELIYQRKYYKTLFSIPSCTFKDPDILKADCYFVFFDYSDPQTFLAAEKFIENYLLHYSEPIFLIGNKCDLVKGVSIEKIQRLCANKGLKFFQISARTGFGILKLMKAVTEQVLPRKFNE